MYAIRELPIQPVLWVIWEMMGKTKRKAVVGEGLLVEDPSFHP
jgi:hypothetical protein